MSGQTRLVRGRPLRAASFGVIGAFALAACSSDDSPRVEPGQNAGGASAGAAGSAGLSGGAGGSAQVVPLRPARELEFGGDLAAWPVFARSRERFGAALGSDVRGACPFAPFQSPLNPPSFALEQIYGNYLDALKSRYGFDLDAADYLPLGPVPSTIGVSQGDEAALRGGGGLVLGAEDPESLFRATDFSGLPGSARDALACQMYAASPYRNRGAWGAEAACAALGSVVPYARVSSVAVLDVRWVAVKDCGLPAGLYGDYAPGPDATWRYDWPDYSQRSEAYAEPCVVNFLKLSVIDMDGREAIGWMPQKAVADYTRFEFPYSWSDPDNSSLPDRRGVNRAAFISTRLLFGDGVSLYLGTSPLWLLTRTQLNAFLGDATGESLSTVLLGPTAECSSDDPSAHTPCTLANQLPFAFANSGEGLWVVDALDSRNPRFDPGDRGGNPVELNGTFPLDSLATAWSDTISFFAVRAATEADWPRAAEQLGAMWHSLTNHNKNWERYRMAVVPLDEAGELLLLVPDQAVFELGQPSAALRARLLGADLARAIQPPAIAAGALYAVGIPF